MSHVKVGVGVIIINEQGRILLCKRKASHGEGTYSIPGGKMDAGESIEECARREINEETGLRLNKLDFLGATNNLQTYYKEGAHFVSLIFVCTDFQGNLELKEPEKHEFWNWYDVAEIPEPQFEGSTLAIRMWKRCFCFQGGHLGLEDGVK